MAKILIKYSLNPDGTIPAYALNGGYYPLGAKLLSLSDDGLDTADAEVMSRSDLLAYLIECCKDGDGEFLLDKHGDQYSEESIEAEMEGFLSLKNFSELA